MAFVLAQVAGKNRGDEEDDLEYHVTFPSPTPRTLSSHENDDFVYVGWDDKEPVVMLFGWVGCRDKDLAKYSALYESKGCITVRYIPPTEDFFFHGHKFQRIALKLLELLTDLNLEEHPVIFHMFSNGGCTVYREVTKFISNDASNRIRVQGCVFDSGPAVTTIMGSTYAITETLRGGSKPYRMLMTVIAVLYVSVTGLIDFLISLITKQQRETFCIGLWQELSRDAMRCPQLFLFSRGDKICLHNSIEKFVVIRKKLGIDAQSICWDDSPHVAHYVKHPEVYTQQVHSFLDRCLKYCNTPGVKV